MTDTRKMIHSMETINMKKLAQLKPYKKPPSYKIDSSMGNCCANDPPGYPTYFTQCVYTAHGNSPRRGTPQLLLFGRVVDDGKMEYDAVKARLRKLWRPLPLQHPRTQAWIRDTFCRHRHCYHVPGQEQLPWHDDKRMLIWPGGCLGKTPFGTLKDLKFEIERARKNECFDKWTVEEKNKFTVAIATNNIRIKRECDAAAVPENAVATILVREYYPEFEPTPDLFADGLENPGSWWERLPQRPTPEQCPGESWHAHPCNGSWCQVCGWCEPKKEEAKDAQVQG